MYRTLALGMIALVPLTASARAFRSTVVGKVIDRPYSTELRLLKATQDLRIHGTAIPIEEGEFRFEIEYEFPEAYELVFTDEWQEASWYPVIFFPAAEGDTLRMTLYPGERHEENRYEGSTLQQVYTELQKYTGLLCAEELQEADYRLDSLYDHELVYTPEAKAVLEAARQAPEEHQDSLWQAWYVLYRSGNHLAPEAAALSAKIDSIYTLRRVAGYEYTLRHPSIPGYYMLYREISREQGQDEEQRKRELYSLLSDIYPDHPYTVMTRQAQTALDRMQVGGKYTDFTIPGLDGNSYTLSEEIKRQKITVLHLWASWCGPCRRHGTELLPLYEEFRDRGFGIVGIARESKDTRAMEQAIREHGYPWLNLVELGDEQQIWKAYGAGNAGGRVIVVDSEGTILALDPSAQAIRSILEEWL